MSKIIGYILAEKKRDFSGGYYYDADWDGDIHPTLEAAWEQCLEANGPSWAENVDEYGLLESEVNEADFLPYALTLALPDGLWR